LGDALGSEDLLQRVHALVRESGRVHVHPSGVEHEDGRLSLIVLGLASLNHQSRVRTAGGRRGFLGQGENGEEDEEQERQTKERSLHECLWGRLQVFRIRGISGRAAKAEAGSLKVAIFSEDHKR
jgi:hypothetical protein